MALRNYLNESEEHYQNRIVVDARSVTLPDHGAWEVGLIIQGALQSPHSTNQDFLDLLHSSNPRYTGWPIWLDSRRFGVNDRPYVIDGVWEALLIILDSGWSNPIDFMRLDPKGKFFLRRALEDDIGGSPQPLTALDLCLTTYRVAEAIAVGIAFAQAMEYLPDTTTLAFAFKWTKLRGRQLISWAKPSLRLPDNHFARQDEIITFVNVPLETPLSALSQYVGRAIQPLAEIFSLTLSEDVVEDITRRLIERRQ